MSDKEIKPQYFQISEDGEVSRVEIDSLTFSSCTYPTELKVMIENGDIIVKEWGWLNDVELWVDVK
jgi:hypothetical protein